MTALFKATAEDHRLISEIASRVRRLHLAMEPLSLCMDLDACISNGCPLDLAGLLRADHVEFVRDLVGIVSYLDRNTGELTHGFRPRFAAPVLTGEPAQ
jgi:hypothetical protein